MPELRAAGGHKPGSVLAGGRPLVSGDHSSGSPVARHLKRSTRGLEPAALRRPSPGAASPIDLAPSGVYRHRRHRRRPCALAARFHPCVAGRCWPGTRSALCGTFPGVTPAGCWPAPSPCGARTFLRRCDVAEATCPPAAACPPATRRRRVADLRHCESPAPWATVRRRSAPDALRAGSCGLGTPGGAGVST